MGYSVIKKMNDTATQILRILLLERIYMNCLDFSLTPSVEVKATLWNS